MGEPIAVVAKKTNDSASIRFETNRNFTGMGHEQYDLETKHFGDRPVDKIAQMLLETDVVTSVAAYAQTLTVGVKAGTDVASLQKAIEDFYIYYKPGVAVPNEADF